MFGPSHRQSRFGSHTHENVFGSVINVSSRLFGTLGENLIFYFFSFNYNSYLELLKEFEGKTF